MADDQPRWFRRLDRWAAISWRFLAVIAAIGATVLLLAELRVILVPTVFALFMCTALFPIQRLYQRLNIPKTVASLLAVLSGFVIITLVVLAMIPPVVAEWDELVDSVERAYDDIFLWLEDGPIGLSSTQVADLRDNIEGSQDAILQQLASGAIAGLPVVIEILVGVLLAIVVSFFFLRDGDRMWAWLVHLLPTSEQVRVERAGFRAWSTLTRYLRGLAIVALIDAVGIGIGAYILGLPLVVPIAVLTFFTAFVPIAGAIAAGAVAVLIALADGGPTSAFWMLGIVLLVQQAESNIVSPAIVGRSVEIHPIVVLLGVTAGGAIAGILGAVLVTPLIAVILVLVRELLGDQHDPATDPQILDEAAPETG